MAQQMSDDQQHRFNPNEHLMQIKSGQTSKDYLPVAWRLVWFRAAYPQGSIETEMIHLDMDRETQEEAFAWNAERRRSEKILKTGTGFCVFRAVVKDGMGGVATGTKTEKAASFPDFVEKAETGAIGRALAALGYGTQFTGDEFEEQHRIVDSPVDRQAQQTQTDPTPIKPTQQASSADENPGKITEQQQESIKKLAKMANVAIPANLDVMTFYEAKGHIQRLNKLPKKSA